MNFLISHGDLIGKIRHLPPLPAVVHELDAALRIDTTTADDVVGIVARDQAMTVAALRLANSSFYGVSGRVVTLRDAVQILGLQTLSDAVTTAAVMAQFDPRACAGFDFDGCWRHALSTAFCAQALAQARGIDDCVAYTCGLLHDIGTLALAIHFPDAFSETLAWAARHDAAPIVAEQVLLGIDHAEVGGLLAAHWRFPQVIVDAIRRHHEASGELPDSFVDALHLADNITHALDYSFGIDDMVPPLSLGTWERMHLSNDELQRLFERIESRMPPAGAAVKA
jgi:putative nucleotidyltransferase with HDIG domain